MRFLNRLDSFTPVVAWLALTISGGNFALDYLVYQRSGEIINITFSDFRNEFSEEGDGIDINFNIRIYNASQQQVTLVQTDFIANDPFQILENGERLDSTNSNCSATENGIEIPRSRNSPPRNLPSRDFILIEVHCELKTDGIALNYLREYLKETKKERRSVLIYIYNLNKLHQVGFGNNILPYDPSFESSIIYRRVNGDEYRPGLYDGTLLSMVVITAEGNWFDGTYEALFGGPRVGG